MRNLLIGVTLALAQFTTLAMAQDANYPSRPVTIVVTKVAGGGNDLIARIVASGLSDKWHQGVVVDNLPGAGGIVGAQRVIQAKPDGYTLLLTDLPGQAIAGVMVNPEPYDMARDFTPISRVSTTPLAFTALKTLPVKNLADFIKYAKARPGQLNFGSGGVGSNPHLATVVMMRATGLDMVHIPYGGGAEEARALEGGQIQLMYSDLNTAIQTQNVGEGGTIIAVTGTERSPLVPNVPLVSESDPALKDFTQGSILSVYGPAGMSKTLTAKINADIAEVLKRPDLQQKIIATGSAVATASVDETAKDVTDSIHLWVPVARTIRDSIAK